jgi:hypothetical protein
VQAAASWGQGDPRGALAQLEELLALAPDHKDALRLREAWRAEHEARERQRQAAAAEAEARRNSVQTAALRVEDALGRGELDAAEAALSAAVAELGSHQPLRDLRRRLSEARRHPAEAGPGRLADMSTVGIDARRVAAARELAAAAAASRPPHDVLAGGMAPGQQGWGGAGGPGGASAGGSVPGWAPADAAAGWQPLAGKAAAAPEWLGSPTARLAAVLGAVVLFGLLLLGLWWVLSVPSPPATPGAVPAASPASGVGGTADP